MFHANRFPQPNSCHTIETSSRNLKYSHINIYSALTPCAILQADRLPSRRYEYVRVRGELALHETGYEQVTRALQVCASTL